MTGNEAQNADGWERWRPRRLTRVSVAPEYQVNSHVTFQRLGNMKLYLRYMAEWRNRSIYSFYALLHDGRSN
jgi:hypothetical protein